MKMFLLNCYAVLLVGLYVAFWIAVVGVALSILF